MALLIMNSHSQGKYIRQEYYWHVTTKEKK